MEAKIQKVKSRWNICYYLVGEGGGRHVRKSLACAKKLAEDLQKREIQPGNQKHNA